MNRPTCPAQASRTRMLTPSKSVRSMQPIENEGFARRLLQLFAVICGFLHPHTLRGFVGLPTSMPDWRRAGVNHNPFIHESINPFLSWAHLDTVLGAPSTCSASCGNDREMHRTRDRHSECRATGGQCQDVPGRDPYQASSCATPLPQLQLKAERTGN